MLLENFTKLNRLSRGAVSAALIGIVAIAMYTWMVSPHVTYLFAAQQYESTLDKKLKNNKSILSQSKVKMKELQQSREQFAELQSKLFTPNEAEEFLSDLEAIAKEADCAVYSLNFSTSEPIFENAQYKDALYVATNKAMLVIIGAYENIIRFTEKLQMHAQEVWIDSLKMEALDGNSTRLKCNMTITIYTIQHKETTVNG